MTRNNSMSSSGPSVNDWRAQVGGGAPLWKPLAGDSREAALSDQMTDMSKEMSHRVDRKPSNQQGTYTHNAIARESADNRYQSQGSLLNDTAPNACLSKKGLSLGNTTHMAISMGNHGLSFSQERPPLADVHSFSNLLNNHSGHIRHPHIRMIHNVLDDITARLQEVSATARCAPGIPPQVRGAIDDDCLRVSDGLRRIGKEARQVGKLLDNLRRMEHDHAELQRFVEQQRSRIASSAIDMEGRQSDHNRVVDLQSRLKRADKRIELLDKVLEDHRAVQDEMAHARDRIKMLESQVAAPKLGSGGQDRPQTGSQTGPQAEARHSSNWITSRKPVPALQSTQESSTGTERAMASLVLTPQTKIETTSHRYPVRDGKMVADPQRPGTCPGPIHNGSLSMTKRPVSAPGTEDFVRKWEDSFNQYFDVVVRFCTTHFKHLPNSSTVSAERLQTEDPKLFAYLTRCLYPENKRAATGHGNTLLDEPSSRPYLAVRMVVQHCVNSYFTRNFWKGFDQETDDELASIERDLASKTGQTQPWARRAARDRLARQIKKMQGSPRWHAFCNWRENFYFQEIRKMLLPLTYFEPKSQDQKTFTYEIHRITQAALNITVDMALDSAAFSFHWGQTAEKYKADNHVHLAEQCSLEPMTVQLKQMRVKLVFAPAITLRVEEAMTVKVENVTKARVLVMA